MMIRFGHIFLYRRDDPVGITILLGYRRDRLYVLRGHVVRPGEGAGGWLSKSKDDDTTFDRDEESDSLLSTGRRLSQSSDGGVVDGTQVESQASEFHFEIEHLFPRMIPEQEGVVAGVRDGDSTADLPHSEGVLKI